MASVRNNNLILVLTVKFFFYVFKLNRKNKVGIAEGCQFVRLHPGSQDVVPRVLSGGDPVQAANQVELDLLFFAGQLHLRSRVGQWVVRIDRHRNRVAGRDEPPQAN